jgi:glutamine amidotransferase/cyclase
LFVGDLVVTKGDQYDVREKAAPETTGSSSSLTGSSSSLTGSTPASSGDVRNLGKPVDLARRYYESGADE